MELHRVVGKSDWENIPPEEWNWWQRQAARTNGWGTPANVVTGGGTAAFFVGLGEVVAHNWVAAGACITGARLCDWVDGYIADKTGTKCVQGQALDAGLDKLQLLAALGLLTATNIMPWEMSVPIVGVQAVTAAVSYEGRRRGVNIQPNAPGKLAMAFASGSVIFDIGSRAAEVFGGAQSEAATVAQSVLEYSAYGGAAGTVGAGLLASAGYAWQTWGPDSKVIEIAPVPEIETAPPSTTEL
ncbi:MAG TPA: CDP-alcohol phosphatidyltransferase family protein [Candidatus Saccharimonadales bacterium]|nr:CDP-alcohol phosphatidyltransferase family protein [Candidatus Saccharimonadales bacterium]